MYLCEYIYVYICIYMYLCEYIYVYISSPFTHIYVFPASAHLSQDKCMYKYAYIHACMYEYAYIHACMYEYAYIHACMYAYAYMHTCMHACMHAYIKHSS